MCSIRWSIPPSPSIRTVLFYGVRSKQRFLFFSRVRIRGSKPAGWMHDQRSVGLLLLWGHKTHILLHRRWPGARMYAQERVLDMKMCKHQLRNPFRAVDCRNCRHCRNSYSRCVSIVHGLSTIIHIRTWCTVQSMLWLSLPLEPVPPCPQSSTPYLTSRVTMQLWGRPF